LLIFGKGETLAGLDQFVGQRNRLYVLVEALPYRARRVV
jgi:hypothetical protein